MSNTSGTINMPRRPGPARKWAAATLLGLVLFLIAGATAVGGWRYRSSGGANSAWLAPVGFVASGFFLIASVGLPLGLLRESSLKEEEEWKCERDCNQLDAALAEIGNKTLRGLAQANFRQMRTFTVIAQRQARMSYYASLAASVISLFVLITGAAAANGLTATPAKITAGSLAAAGAALSGFLAKIFLGAYSMASRQMSYYYGQPLVHCYLLHAEWLASVEAPGNDALWQKIIEASLHAAASAQNHLLDLQDAGQDPDAGAASTSTHALVPEDGKANGLVPAAGSIPNGPAVSPRPSA